MERSNLQDILPVRSSTFFMYRYQVHCNLAINGIKYILRFLSHHIDGNLMHTFKNPMARICFPTQTRISHLLNNNVATLKSP